MPKLPIVLTKHASDRAIKYDLDSQTIRSLIEEGQRKQEGKTKTKYTMRTKRGTLIAVCSESSDQIIVITFTMGGR